jgi:hypothetical protein
MPASSIEEREPALAYWLDYFAGNQGEPALPWRDPYRLSRAERAAVIPSIQQFQLGENASGRRLLRSAEARADESGDSDYRPLLRLFIGEEQRHSQLLARFLASQQAPCLRRHWVHGAFRWLRGVAGLEVCMRVLASAEIIAMPYYTALRQATRCPLLRAICDRVLLEESAHLRFQSYMARTLAKGRSRAARGAVWAAHGFFLACTCEVVWVEHRAVFESGGYTRDRFRRQCRAEFAALRERAEAG